MSGVYHLEITESKEALNILLRQQTRATDRDRVHLLYLLKSGQVATMQEAAVWLGRHRVTVQKWAKRYRDGGLVQLLAHAPHTGDKSTLPALAETAFKKRLGQPEGFESYAAIQDWLATHLGIVAPYKTVHKWVYYRLGAAPKVVRPKSDKQDEAALAAYKKTG